MLTFWNTSQGSAKSIITAPSEIRNATGMLPRAGGVSGRTTGEAALSFPSFSDLAPNKRSELPANVPNAGRTLKQLSTIHHEFQLLA